MFSRTGYIGTRANNTHGSRENTFGSCQVFGFGSIDTRQESLTSFVSLDHRSQDVTDVLWRFTTYCKDGRMPRRTVIASGANRSHVRLLVKKGRNDEMGPDDIVCNAIVFFAKNSSVVSGIARDCKSCCRLSLEHSRMLEISLLIPSLVTPLNIQSHAILQQMSSVGSCLEDKTTFRRTRWQSISGNFDGAIFRNACSLPLLICTT